MDENQKDIKIDNKGLSVILSHKNQDLYFIYKKIEAITGALFLITNSLLDTEILKPTIRIQALATLEQITSILTLDSVNIVDLNKIAGRLAHVGSLVDIAFWSNLISQMNASIISKEIGGITKFLSEIIEKQSKEHVYLDASFFETPSLTAFSGKDKKELDINKSKPVLYKGQTKRHDIKDNNVLENVHKERREKIISFLAHKNNASVKDVLTVLAGYSEKTIQRELLALVDEGILKKEGERRWSTYSLA